MPRMAWWLEIRREIYEVWVMIFIAVAQVSIGGVHVVNHLAMAPYLRDGRTDAAAMDTAFVDAAELLLLVGLVCFLVLFVRRESPYDLGILLALSLVANLVPLRSQVKKGLGGGNVTDVEDEAGLLPQALDVTLFALMGACTLVLFAVASRVQKEFSWRQGHHAKIGNQDLRLATTLGVLHHLDLFLTTATALLPIASPVRALTDGDMSVVVLVPLALVLPGLSFLLLLLYLSTHRRLVRRRVFVGGVGVTGLLSAVLLATATALVAVKAVPDRDRRWSPWRPTLWPRGRSPALCWCACCSSPC